MGYEGVQQVRRRYLELEINEKLMRSQVRFRGSRSILSNPVIEDYRIEWETSAEA